MVNAPLSTWPDEPRLISNAPVAFAREHGGALTNRVLDEHEAAGNLECAPPYHVLVCLRVSYVLAGEQQHVRPDWHFDLSERGWVYIAGHTPTEVAIDPPAEPTQDVEHYAPIHLDTIVEHTATWHRCPVAVIGGWRYFLRVMHAKQPPRPRLVLKDLTPFPTSC